jgi:hypothetical protein
MESAAGLPRLGRATAERGSALGRRNATRSCLGYLATVGVLFVFASLLFRVAANPGSSTHDSSGLPSMADRSSYQTEEPQGPGAVYSPSPEWQYVASLSGTGGYRPLSQIYRDIGSDPDTRAVTGRFRLHGGPVRLKWSVYGGSNRYLIVQMEHLEGSYWSAAWDYDLDTNARSGMTRLDKPAGTYRMLVGSVNCRWRLELWEKR